MNNLKLLVCVSLFFLFNFSLITATSPDEIAIAVRQDLLNNPLKCPFPQILNEQAQEAQERTNVWAKHFKLVPHEKRFAKLCASKFAYLMAGAHPYTEIERLSVIVDWTTMLFINDDYTERLDPVNLKLFNAKNIQVLRNQYIPVEEDHALTHAIYDLKGRIEAYRDPAWMERFVNSFEMHLQSTIWESDNRTAEKIPSVCAYLENRPYTGACYVEFDLIELAEDTHIPNNIFNQYLSEISLASNNIICWSNDIISLPKECREEEGVKHNLVYIVQEEKECSFQEAIAIARMMHDNEVERFLDLREALLNSDEPDVLLYRADIEKYMDGLMYWMGSHYSWALTSARYQ